MIVFNKKMMFFLKRQPISNRLSKGLTDLLKEGITVNGQCIFFKRFYVLNSSSKCNGIHINNLFKFFVWCEVSKSFTRSII